MPPLGSVFQQSADRKLNVRALRFVDGRYLDIGRREGLGGAVVGVAL
jgi:hypothetical protein